MDLRIGKKLLKLCQTHRLPISEVMKLRECELGETTDELIRARMKRVLEIMKEAAFSPILS